MSKFFPPIYRDIDSVGELLGRRAGDAAASGGYSFFQGDDVADLWLKYGDLHEQSIRVAATLQRATGRADRPMGRSSTAARVIVLCSPGPSYFRALFGALYSGLIAVTAYPPRPRRRDTRLETIVDDCQAEIALVDQTTMDRKDQILQSSPGLAQLRWINVDDIEFEASRFGAATEVAASGWELNSDRNDLAILQYTSGSTSDPKGVQLTHGNLLANLEMIHRGFHFNDERQTTAVSWLPPYHDMGLIGAILSILYNGMTSHMMPPAAFVQKPVRWLRTITHYQGGVSGGPNFAFDMCVDRISDADLVGLDLSSWTLAYTGAEPIRDATLRRFCKRFEPVGFDPRAIFACYGLAEATLMVAGGPTGTKWHTRIGPESQPAVVSCGPAVDGQQVVIVDPKTMTKLEDGNVGEICASGANVSPGYWQRPEINREVFQNTIAGFDGQFLRTGDLGFFRDGQLYVSGRQKELIIIRGRNLYPTDLEASLRDCHDRIIGGSIAAVELGSESQASLGIVAEVERLQSDEQGDEIVATIRGRLVEQHEIDPAEVYLIAKHSLPKTSSGKIRRLESARLCGDGTYLKSAMFSHRSRHAGDDEDGVNFDPSNSPRDASSVNEIAVWLTDRLAKHLGQSPSKIDVDRPFSQYGLDSVSAVAIAADLQDFVGKSIPATLLYDAPTIAAVAKQIGTPQMRTRQFDDSSVVEARSSIAVKTQNSRRVAIVGMACRLPGCDDLDQFWDLLVSCGCAITDPPPGRKHSVGELPITRRAGWLRDVDQFDAARFNISPREARWIDPQHRLLLETTWRAIEDATWAPNFIGGQRIGVFVGIAGNDYQRHVLSKSPDRTTYRMTGNATSMAAHRLSYHFDLRGPSIAIDTACSSSLVATHSAVRSIQCGDSDSAIVAGVNLILGGDVSDALADGLMLSPDALCRSFDAAASGYVRGEGCVSIILKSYDAAVRDGDPIRAVICGSAVNQDGMTNGITAPNGESQTRLYEDALRDGGMDPSAITRIEAHGTGTPLGDPIEVNGLASVYGKPGNAPEHRRCVVGSLKANVGHLEAAAGLAGLAKLVLEIERGEITPQSNLTQINPHINLNDSQLVIDCETRPWTSDLPRVGAVSSFGFGGTNAHVLLSQPPATSSPKTPPQDQASSISRRRSELVILSAAHPEALSQTAADHAGLFRSGGNLTAIASAMMRQKGGQRYRVALVGERARPISDSLRKFSVGASPPGTHVGTVSRPHQPTLFLAQIDPQQHGSQIDRQWSATSSFYARARQTSSVQNAVIATLGHWGIWAMESLSDAEVCLHFVGDSSPIQPPCEGASGKIACEIAKGRGGLLDVIAQLFVRGFNPDFKAIAADVNVEAGVDADVDADIAADVVAAPTMRLPGYPMRRQRYWFEGGAPFEPNQNDETICEWIVDAVGANLHQVLATIGSVDDVVTSDGERTLQRYAAAMQVIDEIIARYMRRALEDLDVGTQTDSDFDPQRWVRDGVVDSKHLRLLQRIGKILESDDFCVAVAASDWPRWKFTSKVVRSIEQIDADLRSLADEHEVVAREATLVGRCGRSLASVLSGKTPPLSVLFPGGDSSDLESLYRSSPIASCSNHLVARTALTIIDHLAELHPDHKPRVLEVGAGTGGTTAIVYPAISDGIDGYEFTDASPLLIADAARRWQADENMTCRVLNLDQPIENQGFEPRGYDLIIAANVIHATQDIAVTLSALRELLVPGGVILTLEGTSQERFLDLVFGLTQGWWHATDRDLRPHHPLLSTDQWLAALRDNGWSDTGVIEYPPQHAIAAKRQVVWIAASPDDADFSEANVASDQNESANHPPMNRTVSDQVAMSADKPVAAVSRQADLSGLIEQYIHSDQEDRREALQKYLAALLSKTLGGCEIDVDMPVSELGVDSLMSLQLKNRLETDLNLTVPMVAFLEGKSIRDLAGVAIAMGTLNVHAESKSLDATSSDPHDGSLSEGQKALWLIHQRSPDSAAYNFSFAALAKTTINHLSLVAACNEIIRLHPTLRTCYRGIDGVPRRSAAESSVAEMTQKDCRGWSRDRLIQWICDQADKPFDLQTGPVVRFAHLRWNDGDVLAIAMHHIAADLWSMDLLIRQLGQYYAMSLAGVLPPRSLDSFDNVSDPPFDAFVRRERAMLASSDGDRLWNYWKGQLLDAPSVLQLPTTHPRPSHQTFHGNSLDWTLPNELADDLRRYAKEKRTTLFTVLLTCYQVYLSRICHQDDLLVGTIAAGRDQSELESVVGYLLNHLVIRARFENAKSFDQCVEESHRTVTGALEHQAYPFSRLIERLQPPRDPSRSPLVQTMFIWDKPRDMANEGSHGESSIDWQTMLFEQRGAPFDLTLIVFDFDDEMKLSFRYNTDLFDEETIASMSRTLQRLIAAVAENPDQNIRHIELVNQDAVAAQAGGDEIDVDPSLTGWTLIERSISRRGTSIAVQCGDRSLTYDELDLETERLANRISKSIQHPGDIVAMLMPNGVDAIVTIAAIWRAGGAYLPLDPDYPMSRLQITMADSDAALLITHSDCVAASQLSLTCGRLDIDSLASDAHEAVSTVCHPVDAMSPAYVIYTSGSTGRPKGVVVPHLGLANLSAAQQQTFGVTPQDRCLQFASLSFDASVFEMLMAFHCGATLVVLDRSVSRSTTTAIAQSIEDGGVSVATLPPAILSAMPDFSLPNLRVLISAGEALPADLVDQWSMGRRFYNAYGPTESTVWATTHLCQFGDAPTLGRPIANVHAYVVDQNCQACPTMTEGELCLSGPGLALRYHNRPDLTAERFVPNPFSQRFGAVMYRTGDLCRRDNDGNLHFLGRMDDQIKLDGHRIEPGEIAAVLRQYTGLSDAYVLVHRENGRSILEAYLVADEHFQSEKDSSAAVREFVSKQLPRYMVPHRLHWIETLPLTINAKIDVNKLRRMATMSVVSADDVEAEIPGDRQPPLGEVETRILKIWQDVLQQSDFGVTDNFFHLGGASMQALQVADAMTRSGWQMSAEEMFEFQTVRQLAERIKSKVQTTPAIEPASAKPAVPIDKVRSQPRPSETLSRLPVDQVPMPRMVVESLATYLPPKTLTTAEVIAGCDHKLNFPLQDMTGIASRHVGGEDNYAIDMARRAAKSCLSHSKYDAADIELLIACNISRYDGPNFEISYEPSTAVKLKHDLAVTGAEAFDIGNACAGFFTALLVAQQQLLSGTIRTAMIVSGEYITHLTETAQKEIESFLDPRLACLTLGDAAVAVIVELSSDGSGFETLDLYTAGKHHDLCVAKASDQPHGGAIMYTDPIRASAVTLEHAISHAQRIVRDRGWNADVIDHVIMHQTSSTTLDGAVDELNRRFENEICDPKKNMNNLARRGNTATTTHWVAVADAIDQGRIESNDNVVFAISGSGQTIGTALYKFDTLPDRLRSDPKPIGGNQYRTPIRIDHPRFGVEIVVACANQYLPQSTQQPIYSDLNCIEWAARTAKEAIESAKIDAGEIEMLIHTGVYRDQFLSEPAVAAILAGELQINHDVPLPGGRRTLAFDLSDGARGSLAALNVVANQIATGAIECAMVTASEIENNPSADRGLAPMASAIIVRRCVQPGTGLSQWFTRSYPEYLSALVASTSNTSEGARMKVHRAKDLSSVTIECVVDCLAQFRQQHRSDHRGGQGCWFDRVLLCHDTDFDVQVIAKKLGIEPEKIRVPSVRGGEAFTSALACLIRDELQAADHHAGANWLIVSVSAGLTVTCARYQTPGRFETEPGSVGKEMAS